MNNNIIIVCFRQATLRSLRSCRFAKKEGTIQYDYWKLGTLARVFSKHLRMGTARMNNLKKEKNVRSEASVRKEVKWARKNKSRRPIPS